MKPRPILTACFLLCASAATAQSPRLIGVLRGGPKSLLGWEITPLGDQNGDGYDDILVHDWQFYPLPEIHQEKLFYGGPTLDTVPDLVITGATYGGLHDLGDLNGDGYDDFSATSGVATFWKGTVYWGGPFADNERDLYFGDNTFGPSHHVVCGNDIDANGFNELIWSDYGNRALGFFQLGLQPDSSPYLLLRVPNANKHFTFGDQVVAGDFNGDGLTDLATNGRYGVMDSLNGQVYIYFGGPSFDTIPDMIITRPGAYVSYQNYWGFRMTCLDFNGDGYDDLYSGANPCDDTTAYIYFGGPGLDTLPDITLLGKVDVAAPAGDINNDGYEDLIRGYPLPMAGWGWVDIFLGGPDADGERDLRIHNTSLPGYNYEVGRSATGIGDFNGDGVDDFAFAAETAGRSGLVYIYAGGTGPLSVDYDYDPVFPESFLLSQNYPNPFNATTNIEFGLREKGSARLAIHDVLGREVRVLIDRELSGGTYRVEWDGKDKSGRAVASGVYLYKLTAGETVESRKMILLK